MDSNEIIYVASDWITQNLDIGGNWSVLTLTDKRSIDARLCQDFLCWWELAINGPGITQLSIPLTERQKSQQFLLELRKKL